MVVERAVQAVQYLRTMKSQLYKRHMTGIDIRHPVVAWLCEHSMFLMNRLEGGADGKTAHERCKGKRAKVLG